MDHYSGSALSQSASSNPGSLAGSTPITSRPTVASDSTGFRSRSSENPIPIPTGSQVQSTSWRHPDLNTSTTGDLTELTTIFSHPNRMGSVSLSVPVHTNGSSYRTNEVVALDNPRPRALRTFNQYIQVSRPIENCQRSPHDRSQVARRQHHPGLVDTPLPSKDDKRPTRSGGLTTACCERCGLTLRSSEKDEHSSQRYSSGGIGNFHCSTALAQCHHTCTSRSTTSVIARPIISQPRQMDRGHRLPFISQRCSCNQKPVWAKKQPEIRRKSNKPQKPARCRSADGATASAITRQPRKDRSSSMPSAWENPAKMLPQGARPSIICRNCGQCRCSECSAVKPLPSCWICCGRCLCSVAHAVDVLTCMCCVEGCVYHVTGERLYDPCRGVYQCHSCFGNVSASPGSYRSSTSPNNATNEASWFPRLIFFASSLLLPCMWCYYPLKGVEAILSICYQKAHNTGCHCNSPSPGHSMRSLDSSESDLSASSTLPLTENHWLNHKGTISTSSFLSAKGYSNGGGQT